MYDVAVIGAGPAGSRVAHLLAEKSRGVIVLERQASPAEKCCTGIVSVEFVNKYEIPDSVILRRASSARLFSPSGVEIHVKRDEPQAVILDRGAFDGFLRERGEKAGAEFRYGSKVSGLEIKPDGIVITASECDKESKIEAKAAVIACGYVPALLKR
ncbi:MAG TPA: FAD-dependent oxidoreductase, partial [Dehalococcoidales bacterium]|nr:FAD-dependent oxidoreductase [Dehalococcoidales bacterium]